MLKYLQNIKIIKIVRDINSYIPEAGPVRRNFRIFVRWLEKNLSVH